MSDDINTIVHNILKRVGELDESREIRPSDDIGEDLGIDSLARIDVIVGIERHYGIVFNEADMVDVTTVSDLLSVTEETVNGSRP
ncbi:acyl carrier protein [Rhizobium sp. SJZ105]|uniref:acyl carrier protein n=1 Tax=Rhizobium sp. SJZ105 TaxID=2572678 RepID=UPI0011A89174|nr:acyl carrier protein [Rhizobium sp. SJZ105]TWC76339.1 acyl carrier protein [Rhizobium sp. SJZ105]